MVVVIKKDLTFGKWRCSLDSNRRQPQAPGLGAFGFYLFILKPPGKHLSENVCEKMFFALHNVSACSPYFTLLLWDSASTPFYAFERNNKNG